MPVSDEPARVRHDDIDVPWPPASPQLKRFPRRTLAAGTTMYRLHSRDLNPFWFSSTPPDDTGGNRFDLAPPRGTSYWALQAVVSILETIARRPVQMIPDALFNRFALTSAPLPHDLTDIANLPVKAARRFGLTAEIHTTSNRLLTRAWAVRLADAGFSAILAFPRHDVTARHRALSLWDGRGEHEPYGWSWEPTTGPVPAALKEELGTWGISVTPIPFDVEVIEPPL